MLTLLRAVIGYFWLTWGATWGGELWELGRGAWSAGSGKTLQRLSYVYTYVPRYDSIMRAGNIKRFFEHPRMSERMRTTGGLRSQRTS